jgi:hypothetical protein
MFLDLDTRRGQGSASRPGRFYPRERPGTYFTGGWVGPKDWSGQVLKISPQPGFDSRIVQPVDSRYTNWATRPRKGKGHHRTGLEVPEGK